MYDATRGSCAKSPSFSDVTLKLFAKFGLALPPEAYNDSDSVELPKLYASVGFLVESLLFGKSPNINSASDNDPLERANFDLKSMPPLASAKLEWRPIRAGSSRDDSEAFDIFLELYFVALYSVLVVIELERMSRRYSGCFESDGAFSGVIDFFSTASPILFSIDDADDGVVVVVDDEVVMLIGLYSDGEKLRCSNEDENVDDGAAATAADGTADVPALFLSNGLIRSFGL